MELTADARRALPAIVGLLLGRREALARLDTSLPAFWRVFWLALGGLAAAEVAITTLAAPDHPLEALHGGAVVALSVLGGSALAMQVVVAMAEMEDWRGRPAAFLVPLLWIGVGLWGAAVLWRLSGLGTDAAVWWALAGLAALGVWQAARLGLDLTRGAAFGVAFVYALSSCAGYALVNATALVVLPT